jgi:hypothetical protein
MVTRAHVTNQRIKAIFRVVTINHITVHGFHINLVQTISMAMAIEIGIVIINATPADNDIIAIIIDRTITAGAVIMGHATAQHQDVIEDRIGDLRITDLEK